MHLRSTLILSILGLFPLTIYLKPRDNHVSTSIYYKDTDSHSYLNFSSSHPSSCKSSIPYSQFLRLRKICSENDDFESEANKMETFFVARGYPNDLIRRGRERASIKSRAELLENNAGNNTANDRVPLVTTFHPMNQDACKIISGNFRILHDDSTTNNIFRKPPLMAFQACQESEGPVSQKQPTAGPTEPSNGYISLQQDRLPHMPPC